ncbi:MAG: TonB-dependent receptor [Bacteroidales bacterium]|nr:TonB-dependent receptor [Bacteroidales bacterium]
MKKQKWCLVIVALLIGLTTSFASDDTGKRITLSGHLTDAQTGESLIGATIYIKELQTGTVTNPYGFYSLSLEPNKYTLVYSFIGYQVETQTLQLEENQTINLEMTPSQEMLKEVVIKGERANENVVRNQMSVEKMDVKTIRSIPAMMGEVDIIKAIQLLPGVQTAVEGSSGYSVRGGNPDHNLIQLDEAGVYNASHLMGFFSVFNNEAIKNVELYKGDIPASAGGRLASLLDVRMKEGNNKEYHASGGIGIISSRLAIEGPITENISFLVAGRRSYADLFLPLAPDTSMRNSKLYFYDLNGKINWTINENNRIFVSSYMGEDVFGSGDFGMGWGNRTSTARWNHLFSKKLFSNLTLTQSRYNYNIGTPESSDFSFNWNAQLDDYAIKYDFTYYSTPNFTMNFGVSSAFHHILPGKMKAGSNSSTSIEFEVQKNNSLESGIYWSAEHKVNPKLTLKYGLRYSMFNNIGEGVSYNYDENYNKIDSTFFNKGEIYQTYGGLEPRLGINYVINPQTSVKASYSRTRQYIQLARNSTAGTPLDIWFPASPNVKPQISDQVAVGVFRNFNDDMFEASVEGYYKDLQNTIDFKNHAELLLNELYEGELRTGKGWAYGAEFMLRINHPIISGWVSYTLSSSWRQAEDINDGNPYRSHFDKPHDVSVVLNYNLNDHFQFGMNWIFSTGNPVTFPVGRANYGDEWIPIYSKRNSYRMPNYHRMDLSVTYKPLRHPERRWQGEWNLSVYNAYNKKNAWVINFIEDEVTPGKMNAEMTYLFGIIPSITYNFKF